MTCFSKMLTVVWDFRNPEDISPFSETRSLDFSATSRVNRQGNWISGRINFPQSPAEHRDGLTPCLCYLDRYFDTNTVLFFIKYDKGNLYFSMNKANPCAYPAT